jgi:hypothetical protein
MDATRTIRDAISADSRLGPDPRVWASTDDGFGREATGSARLEFAPRWVGALLPPESLDPDY